MTDHDTKVLLGDSTPSTLPPNILDVIVELVRCVREIGVSYVAVSENLRLLDKLERTTREVTAELDKFRHRAELGVRATGQESSRPEVRQHAEEIIAQLNRMVDGYKQRYANQLSGEQQKGAGRREHLQRTMHEAVEAFLAPMRGDSQHWVLQRVLGEAAYDDTLTAEPIAGIRLTLSVRDPDPEVPRKMRTLLGKGVRLQVGVKKSRLRRTEEPAWLLLDDLVIVESDTSPTRARLTLSKKPGTKEAVQLEIVMTDAGPSGSALTAVGTMAALPASDRSTMTMIWSAIAEESARLFAAPARVVGIALDGDEVIEANGMLATAERLIEHFRPVIANIVEHSPNPEEMTIKIERDGKREETWIRRDELAEHLRSLPDAVRGRLAIAELGVEAPVSDGADAAIPLADLLEPEAFGEETQVTELPSNAGPVRQLPPPSGRGLPRPPGLERPGTGVPGMGMPAAEITQDISLTEVEVDGSGASLEIDEVELDDDEDDELASKTRVRY